MDEEFFKLSVDDTLTVRTAYQRGYRWVMDVGRATPHDLLTDIFMMVKEQGYKLGKPRYIWPEKGTAQDRGLYEPLKKNQTGKKEEKR